MVSAARPGTWFASLALMLLGVGVLSAQSFPRTLNDIRMTVADGKEVVRFQFSQPYEGEPKQEHERGQLRLNFFGTGSPVPVRSFRVNDSQYIREIRIQQNQYSTTVTLMLVDGVRDMKGRVAFTRNASLLQLALDTQQPQDAPPAAAKSDKELLVEMTDKIAGKTTPAETSKQKNQPAANTAPKEKGEDALGKFDGVEWMPAMLTMIFSLGVLVAVLYGVLYLYNRFIAVRLNQGGSTQLMRQIASFHIGPKQKVVILDIMGERIACGVTPTQITFLTKLDSPSRAAASRRPAPGSTPPETKSSSSGKGGQKSAETKSVKQDPMQQFADALKEKVGTMKPLK